ncbi:tyrosine--tRNA ligase [Thermoanaerobacterium sp. RBIITD]|uniref:tyrosine--tRNA ligase n=1 Tax=Thermoanaerobacterium sp. RBIITD TaxID=1550240 RepID=UPI000BB9304C|nr:tyrosine--tRNA ligase [Thermoanaerobacterium sp. RBIITD]SNX53182.1 tyrosyl-tRNA synthetase [Thermoanaerobacterium sp. RBIITD]
MSVFDILKERNFIEQMTHEDEIKELLDKKKVTFYIGFDPTADSLHVGHFLQLMVMAHMQRAGHRPIVLIGGGTAMVGDPTGKTDMRKMLTKEEISHNAESFKKQMSRFIDFSGGKAILANNADWLLNLNYVEFLRDIGIHFSVNKMLTAECFKTRLERGLSFLEFNYMLMQAYDFLMLNQKYDCILEMGGDDQWSNILAGVDLVRRKEGKQAYGMTFTLLTTSEGKKMGKTEKGAIWLDPEKTPPYDFYQYWRNVDDSDVEKCLSLLTFLPMDEVRRLGSLKDKEINEAKKVLAYEVTKLVHGEDEANKAQKAAEALFEKSGDLSNVPTLKIPHDMINTNLLDVLVKTNIIPSKSEGRRLIKQGGLYVNDVNINDIDTLITEDLFKNGYMLVRKGKKSYNKIIVE